MPSAIVGTAGHYDKKGYVGITWSRYEEDKLSGFLIYVRAGLHAPTPGPTAFSIGDKAATSSLLPYRFDKGGDYDFQIFAVFGDDGYDADSGSGWNGIDNDLINP